ncbi:MAG TPA: sulfotransferase [Bryobacteraceae bacterium]|nr:sulfotransferase [Bryobacteraceae bacterium]
MAAPSGTPRESPVFIFGSGRCGSTLLQSVVNSNPAFLIWGEHNGFLRFLADAYFKTANTASHRNIRVPGESPAAQVERLRNPAYWGGWDNPLNSEGFEEHFRRFLRGIFVPEQLTATRWGFKEIRYGIHSRDRTPEFLQACFPEARFLVIVRHPVDTVFSVLAAWHRDSAVTPVLLDRALFESTRRWARQYERLFLFHHSAQGRSLIIKYEDLIAARCLDELWTFLEAPQPASCRRVLESVKDACPKNDEFAHLIRARMGTYWKDLNAITHQARRLYGYSEGWQADGHRALK